MKGAGQVNYEAVTKLKDWDSLSPQVKAVWTRAAKKVMVRHYIAMQLLKKTQ